MTITRGITTTFTMTPRGPKQETAIVTPTPDGTFIARDVATNRTASRLTSHEAVERLRAEA